MIAQDDSEWKIQNSLKLSKIPHFSWHDYTGITQKNLLTFKKDTLIYGMITT